MSSRVYPKGLFFLVFTEFWERFGYYLMIGIFTLYMTADVKEGGFGWDNAEASDVYGTFIALVFLTPFMGGLLGDLKLGYRFSITAGGILMGVGYCMLAIPEKWAFYTALAVMVIGNGLFKPNMSAILGNLFNDDRYRDKKDTGYNFFYMGINLGAFVCNFVAAVMRNKIGWHGAFIAAGVGMFIGVITFWTGIKHYRHADVRKEPAAEDRPLLMSFLRMMMLGCGLAALAYAIPGTISSSNSSDAFFAFCLPVVYFFYTLYRDAGADDKRALSTMFTVFIIVILFWAIFKQNGSALTTYAKNYTDRGIPASLTPAARALGFSEEIKAVNGETYQVDEQFRKIKGPDGEPVKCSDYPSYFKNALAADIPPPGGSAYVFNTEIFQSVNPFFVVTLTPLLIAFFGFLRARRREPTTGSKIAAGLFISALSTLVMVAAVYHTNNGMSKAGAGWLIACYGVITVGELCLSPMGLSMVSKLSPPKLTALMMGGWYLATSVGNKISGELSRNWDKFDNKANFFLVNFLLLLIAFLIMLSQLRRLNEVFRKQAH